jgi:toxin ParE1/3/4
VRDLRILDAAAEEAIGAAEFYESRRHRLGADFDEAPRSAFDLLEGGLLPLTVVPGPAGERGAKRFVMRRFPYSIVVKEDRDAVVIVAVAHHAKRPGYWRGRLQA